MTYNDQGGRPHSGGRSGSSRQLGSRPQLGSQGSYHGPRGTRQRNGGLKGPGRGGGRGGYPLRERSINFRSGRARRMNDSRQLILLAAIALVLVILIVVAVTSCVNACSGDTQQPSEVNAVDSRVAVGVSEELTREFSAELDRGEKIAQIAANASAYADTGLLELALSEPSAVDFVAAYPEAEKAAQSYDDSVTQGTVPELYCWDGRWGCVDYADRALALTGSGPTSLAMAYMGLTGSSEQTPATIAELATSAGMASGDSSMSAEFLTGSLSDLGLTCTTYTSNADNLSQMIDSGSYVLMEASAGSLTDQTHWVVAVAENEDGTVVLHDPTSPDVTAQSWTPATVAASCTTLYVITLAE